MLCSGLLWHPGDILVLVTDIHEDAPNLLDP
jgi:hypothetical protein